MNRYRVAELQKKLAKGKISLMERLEMINMVIEDYHENALVKSFFPDHANMLQNTLAVIVGLDHVPLTVNPKTKVTPSLELLTDDQKWEAYETWVASRKHNFDPPHERPTKEFESRRPVKETGLIA